MYELQKEVYSLAFLAEEGCTKSSAQGKQWVCIYVTWYGKLYNL